MNAKDALGWTWNSRLSFPPIFNGGMNSINHLGPLYDPHMATVLPYPATGKRSWEEEGDFDVVVKKRRTAEPEASVEESDIELDDADEDEDETVPSDSTPRTSTLPTASNVSSVCRPKKYLCPYESCTKAFSRPSRLDEHVRSHTNTRPFQCPHKPCEKAFYRQSHLSHHVKSAHSDIRDHACTWQNCGKSFATATRLRRHVEAHEGKNKFRCTEYPPCDKSFRKHATLQRHVDADHLSRKPFTCEEVDRLTGELCSLGFDTHSQIANHKRRTHGNVKFFECLLCSFDEPSGPNFASHAELQAHVASIHPPFCDICQAGFFSSRGLEDHVQSQHSGQSVGERKTIVCPEPDCDKRFTKQSNLNAHSKQVHGQEKKFVCGETDLSSTKGLEQWSGEKSCGSRFGAKASLVNHVKKQHLERPKTKKTALASEKASIMTKTAGGYGSSSMAAGMGCLDPSCTQTFDKLYDLEIHALLLHGMDASDVTEALAEREALAGGQFWIGDEEDVDDPDIDHGAWALMDEANEEVRQSTRIHDHYNASVRPTGSNQASGIDDIDPMLFECNS